MSKTSFREISLFLLHMLLLCAFSLFAFRYNAGRLYTGNDGPELLALVYEQMRFIGFSTDLYTNFLQGMGNLSFPMNTTAIPGFWFGLYDAGGPSMSAIVNSYVWFAALLFATVLLVGWNYRFSRGVSYAAAWLLTILFFPYFSGLGIYSITSSAPVFAIYIFSAAVADVGIRRMGSGNWRSTIFYAGLLLAAILFMLIASPAALILILPFLTLSTVLSLISAPRGERLRKLIAAAALLLLAVIAGWAEYIIGLLLNTSSGFYIKELMATYPPNRIYVSIFFQGLLDGMTMGPWLFAAGTLGAAYIFFSSRTRYLAAAKPRSLAAIALLTLQTLLFAAVEWHLHIKAGWKWPTHHYYQLWLAIAWSFVVAKLFISAQKRNIARNVPLRPAATVLLLGQALLLLAGEWLVNRQGGWTGPALVYYEMPLFALYALFGVFLAVRCARVTPVARIWPAAADYVLPIAGAAALTLILRATPAMDVRNPYNYALPPVSTPLVSILDRQIAIRPGAPFAGRVVSSIPGGLFHPQVSYFSEMNAKSGNDHQTTGLWLRSIPTLHEYSPMITPGFYKLIRGFLSTQEDIQNRSWTNFSRLDLRLLRLIGVRFILSTAPSFDKAQNLASLSMPPLKPLHLFELRNANIAGIGARRVVSSPNVNQAVEMMSAPAFDAQTALVMGQGAPGLAHEWMPARHSDMAIEKGAYHVRAQSDGWTLLILPVEYSRCLTITPLTGAMPEAVRVDVALTGLVFDRALDVAMVQRVGPFTHPRCRFQDYLDFKALLP